MNPPLSRSAKVWLAAVLAAGIALLAAIAWLGRGPGPAAEQPPVAATEPAPKLAAAPLRPARAEARARPAPASVPAAAPSPAAMPAPAPPAPPVDAGLAISPAGSRWRSLRALRPLIGSIRPLDGGAPVPR